MLEGKTYLNTYFNLSFVQSCELEATSYQTSHEESFRGFVLEEKSGFRVAPFCRSRNPGGREPLTVTFFLGQISDTIHNERDERPVNPLTEPGGRFLILR